MPLPAAALDHVAVAVADVAAAVADWESLGAGRVSGGSRAGVWTEQVRLTGGAKIELIGPDPEHAGPTFIQGFLDRFGAGRVHHVTVLARGDLLDALQLLQAEGLPAVDVDVSDEHWQEAFLRPSLVGGLIAQVATQRGTSADYAARMGRPAPRPAEPGAPALCAVRLQHTDLDRSAAVWTSLGAGLTWSGDDAFRAAWPGSPLHLEVVTGTHPGPVGLVVADLAPGGRTATRPDLLPRSG